MRAAPSKSLEQLSGLPRSGAVNGRQYRLRQGAVMLIEPGHPLVVLQGGQPLGRKSGNIPRPFLLSDASDTELRPPRLSQFRPVAQDEPSTLRVDRMAPFGSAFLDAGTANNCQSVTMLLPGGAVEPSREAI
jgi:hypothetical protein